MTHVPHTPKCLLPGTFQDPVQITHATELIRAGVPIEVVSKRLTHRSVITTSEAYVHLLAEDVRAALVRARVWDEPVVAR